MKKKLFKISLFLTMCLLLFIIAFVVTNIFDAPEPEGIYTLKDLPHASLEPDNGYYRLMTLSYPPEADITSSEIIKEIRKMSEPGLLSLGAGEIHKKAQKYLDVYRKLKIKKIDLVAHPLSENFHKIATDREKFETWLNANPVVMERYSQLLGIEKIADFSIPS